MEFRLWIAYMENVFCLHIVSLWRTNFPTNFSLTDRSTILIPLSSFHVELYLLFALDQLPATIEPASFTH